MTLFKIILPLITLVLVALPTIRVSAHSDKPHSNKQNENTASLNRQLEYEPPAPGSYRLPPIQQAVDGDVVDADGREHHLFELMADKYVILSFIFTTCSDLKGCPLATLTLNNMRVTLEKDPTLAEEVRFLSLSFDPEHDTPEVMRQYKEFHGFDDARRKNRWRFLTTTSKIKLQPILNGYGQYVVREYDSKGQSTGGFSHVLKVYLVDPERKVRNIYSTSFLHPELIINDIKTLILEKAEFQ